MNCINCGNPIVDGNNFCMICGTPVAGASAPQPAYAAPGAPAPAAPAPAAQAPVAQPQQLPYAPPVMEGSNVIIPVGRKFRIVCPDCGIVMDDIKRDTSAGYACRACGKAYAYGGQVLLYRMGNGLPSASLVPTVVNIDGVLYGEIANRESLRIMVAAGTHTIDITHRPGTIRNKVQSNRFQFVIGPQCNNVAFKFSVVYRYMAPYGLELSVCNPQEIPDI